MTITEIVKKLAADLEAMPTNGPSKDLGEALTALPELDKALRKARARMMASLVTNAAQASLELAKGGR